MDITRHLLQCIQFRTPNTGEDVNRQESSLTAGRNGKCYAYFGRQAVSYQTKHTLTRGSSDHTPWYLFTQTN